MKWLIKIMKVGLLTFLAGIVCYGSLFIFLKESLSDLLGLLPLVLVIILMLVCLNILFVFLLYFTAYFLRNDIKENLFLLKYLLLEISLLYILYILSLNIINSDWIRLFTPFAALYVLWLIVILIKSLRHKVD
jgi:hypothetical protein